MNSNGWIETLADCFVARLRRHTEDLVFHVLLSLGNPDATCIIAISSSALSTVAVNTRRLLVVPKGVPSQRSICALHSRLEGCSAGASGGTDDISF